jgi:hypothetical protein
MKKKHMSPEQLRKVIFSLLIERRRQAEEAREKAKTELRNVQSIEDYNPTLTLNQLMQYVHGSCQSLEVVKPPVGDFLIALDELEKKYQSVERMDKEFLDGDTRYKAITNGAETHTTLRLCDDGFYRTAITLQKGQNRSIAILNERGDHVMTLNLFEFDAYYDVDVCAKQEDARTSVNHMYQGWPVWRRSLPGRVIANFITKPEHNAKLELPPTDRVKFVEEWLTDMGLHKWAAHEHKHGGAEGLVRVTETVARYFNSEKDAIGLQVTVRDAMTNLAHAIERSKGFNFGDKTAEWLSKQTATEGNTYEEDIIAAARFLCGEGENAAKYDTHYESGTTCWHTSPGKPKLVLKGGGFTD